ncbi:MAG: 50S ribosomal protein L9 [Candidatus Pacebacteria bacterium]|nr:50S ribosomal protein L9 [Candidatus Paceibacterota bacterium]
MKIILLKDISKLGRKYEVKTVSDGYAINMLIPQGQAIAATADALKRLEKERAQVEGERKIQDELLVKNLEGLKNVTLTIAGKANEKGHLFAGLHKEVIATEIEKQTRLNIDPSFIELAHPLKEVGEHTVDIKAAGKVVKLKVVIEGK